MTSKPPHSTIGHDHFILEKGGEYAGQHLIVDCWDATNLADVSLMDKALREAAKVSGATVLDVMVHEFANATGISGVAVLAESHISVHTWPDRGYAAFDVFMCGAALPQLAIPVFEAFFQPGRIETKVIKRGYRSEPSACCDLQDKFACDAT